jgi:DNA-binding SARP family transcriptional activator
VLNTVEDLVIATECQAYLEPLARYAPTVVHRQGELYRIRASARQMLSELAAAAPGLRVVSNAAADSANKAVLVLSPFGAGNILLNGREIAVAALAEKPREFLFYLGYRGDLVSRDEVLEALWPEDSERGPQALWQATYHLRRLLGQGAVSRVRGSYGLHGDVTDHGRLFEELGESVVSRSQAVRRTLTHDDFAAREEMLSVLANVEEALGLVRAGAFLEWCAGMWAVELRARHGARARRLALMAVPLYERLEREEDALRMCDQAIAGDQFEEESWFTLIGLHARKGRVREALQAFAKYRALLRAELGVEPSAQLNAFVRMVKQRGVAGG